jgi:hypothetical protein
MNKDLDTPHLSCMVCGLSLALACLATSLIFTSVTVVFTAGANAPAVAQFAGAGAALTSRVA